MSRVYNLLEQLRDTLAYAHHYMTHVRRAVVAWETQVRVSNTLVSAAVASIGSSWHLYVHAWADGNNVIILAVASDLGDVVAQSIKHINIVSSTS